MRIGYETGIDAVSSFRNVRAPKGWSRPACSICGKPMSGMVANPVLEIGKKALESVRRYRHGECAKRNKPTIATPAITTNTNTTSNTESSKKAKLDIIDAVPTSSNESMQKEPFSVRQH
jgi:hypothetical protein